MKIFISDLHLGCGDPLEDFVLWEKEELPLEKTPKFLRSGINRMHEFFSDFLEECIRRGSDDHSRLELIFLGDTFDLLQVLPEERRNPEKVNLIAESHQPFFKALRRFHDDKGGDVTFILGNHDHDLLYPELWDTLIKHVPFANHPFGGKPLLFYHDPEAGIYAEHGNQYDTLNAFENPSDPEEWPFGSELVLRLVNPLERSYPIIDNLGVRECLWYAIRHVPEVLSKAQRKDLLLAEALNTLSRENRLQHLAYFLLHQLMPTSGASVFQVLWRLLQRNEELLRDGQSRRRHLKGLLYTFKCMGRNPLRIFQEFLSDRLREAAFKMAKGKGRGGMGNPKPAPKFILLGHAHRPCVKKTAGDSLYVNTGSWKMRAVPYRRLSFQLQQTLDYALAYRTKQGRWQIRLYSWAQERIAHEGQNKKN
jgi:UDP-2,3-diacylglucosamine pyrophosphatase LpxH